MHKRDVRAKIVGTAEHDQIKLQHKLHKREVRAKIVGTAEHDQIKLQHKLQQREVRAKIVGIAKHDIIIERKRQSLVKVKAKLSNVKRFKKEIQNGPYCICVICNRCLYRRSVIRFVETKYEIPQNLFDIVLSHDGHTYICQTCDKKLKKKIIPCQAVYNKLQVDELPTDLKNIRRLERVLVSKRLLFKKITIMPKGQAPKVKGSICNVPIHVVDTCNSLPRSADSNGLLIVKLNIEY